MNGPPLRFTRAHDGNQVCYTVLPGEGVPFVVMPAPGPISMSHMYQIQSFLDYAERLRRGAPFVTFDLRGHGASDSYRGELTIEQFAQDVAAVVDAVGEPVHLHAWFGSCHAAALFAAEHPEYVRSLTLRTPVLTGIWTRPAIRSMGDEDYELAMLFVLRITFDWPPDFPAERLLPAVITAQQSDKQNRARHAPGSALAESTVLSDYLPRVTVPVLVLGVDSNEDRDRVYGAAAMLPHAQLALIPANAINGTLGDDWRDAFDAFWASVSGERPAVAGTADGLSDREVDVIRLLAAGRTNAQIASVLTLSVRTVEHHVGNILQKTGSANRAEATAYAVRNGLA